MSYSARYYDGKRAEPQEALVQPEKGGLTIELPAIPDTLSWEYTSTRITGKPEFNQSLIITNTATPDARLIIFDISLYDYLIQELPYENAPLFAISTSRKSLLLWSIASIAVTVFVYWGIPELTAPIAKYFPASWEQNIGEYTVNAMIADKPVCKNIAGINALAKLVNTLAASAEGHPQITATVIQEKEVNAFAASGGKIVIFSKLIQSADHPDELAGVIAHEMGHTIKHHPTQSLVRALGLSLVVKMVFGGMGGASTAASVANDLFQLQYSRDFEREADQVATEILYNAKIDNRGFIIFFKRLQSAQKATNDKMFSYVSTHPPTSERIAAIQKAKNVPTSTPILNGEEWQALKNICD